LAKTTLSQNSIHHFKNSKNNLQAKRFRELTPNIEKIQHTTNKNFKNFENFKQKYQKISLKHKIQNSYAEKYQMKPRNFENLPQT
jgi:hypothetical protein